MVDSVDVVLEFLRKNRFTKAEAALQGELNARPDLNGFLQKHLSDEKKDAGRNVEEVSNVRHQSWSAQSAESSKEFIVKEIEVGDIGNGFDSTKGIDHTRRRESRESGSGDLYPWNPSTSSNYNSASEDADTITNNFAGLLISEELKQQHGSFSLEKRDRAVGTEPDQPVDQIISCAKGKNKTKVKVHSQVNQISDYKDKNAYSDHFFDDLWVKSKDSSKGAPAKTVFPLPVDMASSSYGGYANEKKEINHKGDSNNIREQAREQIESMSRSYLSGKAQEIAESKSSNKSDLLVAGGNHRDELPRLPPVRLKSEDKLVNMQEENTNNHGSGMKIPSTDSTFMIGSYLDVPVGQEINSAGSKRIIGSNWLSVSQGISEDTSDLVSGFATVGDDSVDYPNDYWDSDEYEDDDDVGYTRQPIEDETWFLAHEIDYPSDNEKGTGNSSVPDLRDQIPRKDEDDDRSFVEEDSYLSGEQTDQYFQGKSVGKIAVPEDPLSHKMPKTHGRTAENDPIPHYDGQLMDPEELSLICSEPVWQGFVTENDELVTLENRKGPIEVPRNRQENPILVDDEHGSVRSIGVGINSDAVDIGSEVHELLAGGSSQGDIEYLSNYDVSRQYTQNDTTNSDLNRTKRAKMRGNKQDGCNLAYEKDISLSGVSTEGGFSFLPLKSGNMLDPVGGKSFWSNKTKIEVDNSADGCANAIAPDDMLANWRKSSDSSPVRSSRDEKTSDAVRSQNSSTSSASNYGFTEIESISKGHHKTNETREEETGETLEDEEIAALQEQVKQIKAQEEEFETFHLKIVHRKNRTGFEEDKNFHVVLNSVIAGRYHVTEYLGSAAFSKAIQAHDLHTGMDVCVKIIKNNKDFFDQSLDEIKLLKFVNKNDPSDKYHILRLYDYFYYREHLLIVCELLKANLYEFHKFNRESGGEVYFTMPRLQSITIQCLEALQFLHGLGLIHCDLKPENILVKSYSRCEVKVIDLGSSCFETDHLCSYVQSRSYRAPEVILGLPYDKKIDIWSLGCILAELCSGNVLFQNDSPATLLARVIGIIGPIDQGMLAKGRDIYKHFTKNHMLYERNQETNRLEYLIPKKTSLCHRLPMGDQGFIEFVQHLLEINPKKRPSASEALKHPWLSFPYEPISS
ncbi:hypothetical protein Cni_G09710 [Canna indica]|uniref:Protein kinase domain-containing protein n=1 Tax=Canna indica TaxID=4628 RepID=A0AAQ3K315_9LILI|nr:hypothetical protein Cni_G09710 [Canna indica]